MLEYLARLTALLSVLSFLVLLVRLHDPPPTLPGNAISLSTARSVQPNRSSEAVRTDALSAITRPAETDRGKGAAVSNYIPSGGVDYHFIHIPKCGGTSMTAILRQMACQIDPKRNLDCCTNPGFCDNNDHRSCKAIKGCVNHLPQRQWLFKSPPSITIMREPVSRLLSAWFYRGHSPNLDFFQVRKEFKEIKLGLRPKVVFEEYVEMPEYQNIQTRMLGANSFPYRNITITPEVFRKAEEALDAFFFVGIQEAYFISVKLLLRETGMERLVIAPETIERQQPPSKELMRLTSNPALMQRVKDVNEWDNRLYKLGVEKFCGMLRKHADLLLELAATTTLRCSE